MATPSDGQRFKTKDKPTGERPDVCPVLLNANAPGVGRATPTEGDKLQGFQACQRARLGDNYYRHIPCKQCDANAQLVANVREQNQETRLKYCPTHRTIVPAFKDHRLSCCVLADEREAAYRAGQQRGWFDARKRSWQLVAAEREKVEIQMRNAIRQGQDIGEYGRIIGWLLAAEHVIENYAVRPEPPPSEGAKL